MAATGYTPISLYYSTTASATPSAGNLVAGELALNTTDEKLYFKNAAGTVKLLASNAATTPTTPGGSTTQVQYNSSGSFAGSASLTFDGTTFTAPNSVITSSSSSNALRITQTGTGNALLVEDSASTDSTPTVIDASGRLIVGKATSSGVGEQLQTANVNTGLYYASTSGSDASALSFARSRGTLTSPTALSAGDTLGYLTFGGYTSNGWVSGAYQLAPTIYGKIAGETSYGGISGSITIANSTTVESPADWIFSAGTNYQSVLRSEGVPYNTGIISMGGGSTLWNNLYSTVEVSNTGSFYGTTAKVDVANNVYYNASNAFIYKTTGFATRYEQTVGTHAWYTAASGTAGATATFTQAMTLTATGGLVVGTTTDPGAGIIADANGNVRKVPQSGSSKTTSYTLATTDVGEYILLGASGAIVIPDATFAAGDVITIFNNTASTATITCSITTAYIAGTYTDKATMTLAAAGVATVLFITSTLCVVSGNVT